MSPHPPRSAFFEDRHTDARMRALIPRFARLASLLTLLSAPLLADGTKLAFLAANAVTAVVVTVVVDRFGLLDRATNRQLQVLLVLYGALIANGTGLAGARSGPYLLMQALPVLFAAVFFAGADRYVLSTVLGVEHALIVWAYGGGHVGYAVTTVALCLLVCHFGVHVANVLREALAANAALHRVLAVSNDAVESDRIPEIGLDAAVSVVGWDAGAVVLREGDILRVAASSGIGAAVRASYDAEPMTIDDSSMSASVARSGQPRYIPDVAAFYGADHPVTLDGIVCMTGVPIRYHGEIIGVLVMHSRTRRTPDERELDRLAQVAEQLGLAIGNMRAHRREALVAGELRELNRRKDAFLAMISHELRTPATTITLAARTLRDSEDRLDPADRAYAHDLLVRRSEELTRMIESLLEEALAESDGLHVQLTSIDWNADLARWVDTARIETGRAVALTVPGEPVTSMADRAKAERIVANLLSNAAKFSPAGAPVECSLSTEAGWLVIRVTDRGPGIPADVRERVFDRFYQVDETMRRAQGGFGIGLSLVRRFAGAHGGSVSVEDAPGGGSVFAVRLPRTVVPAARGPQDTVTEPATV